MPAEVVDVMRDPKAPPKTFPGLPQGFPGRRERGFGDSNKGGITERRPPFGPQGPPGSAMAYGGLPVSLTLADDIPLDPQPGAPLRFTVDQDLRIGPLVLIAKGAAATGEVLAPQPAAPGRPPRAAFKLLTVEGGRLQAEAARFARTQFGPQRGSDRASGVQVQRDARAGRLQLHGVHRRDQPVAIKR